MSVVYKQFLLETDGSIYTNIPEDLVMESIKGRWSFIEKHSYERVFKCHFIGSIFTYFKFDNQHFKQIFSMKFPLSPILANLIIQDLKKYILSSIDINSSLLSVCGWHFTGNIYTIKSMINNQIYEILNSFNSYHDRLRFTA